MPPRRARTNSTTIGSTDKIIIANSTTATQPLTAWLRERDAAASIGPGDAYGSRRDSFLVPVRVTSMRMIVRTLAGRRILEIPVLVFGGRNIVRMCMVFLRLVRTTAGRAMRVRMTMLVLMDMRMGMSMRVAVHQFAMPMFVRMRMLMRMCVFMRMPMRMRRIGGVHMRVRVAVADGVGLRDGLVSRGGHGTSPPR